LLVVPIIVEVKSKAAEHVALLAEGSLRTLIIETAVFEDEAEILPELSGRLIVPIKFYINGIALLVVEPISHHYEVHGLLYYLEVLPEVLTIVADKDS
jgi:hypothetical protein